MLNNSTVVWIHPGFEERERELRVKGYIIQKIQPGGRPKFYDEAPDMVIYAEELLNEYSLFFTINKFFPDTVAISIGTGIGTDDPENLTNSSVNKLVQDIRMIDTEE